MSEIDNFLNNKNQTNYYIRKPISNATPTSETVSQPQLEENAKPQEPAVDLTEVRDEFVKAKKDNGLIRKAYNALKNVSGVGLGSKALEKEIERYKNGEISKEEIEKKISQYKISQENGTQTLGDVAAGAAAITTYLTADKVIKKFRVQNKLNALPEMAKDVIKSIKALPQGKKYVRDITKLLNSNTKTKLLMLPVLAMIGGSTKQTVTWFDRLGSKEYSVDKKDFATKKEYKKAKWAATKASIKQSAKDFATGAADGILAPITTIAGGIVGVPAYLASTLGLKYLTAKNDNDKKSLGGFVEKLKDNAAVNTVGALLIALPALKKAHFNKVLSKNLETVAKNLEGVKLKQPDLPSTKTTYQELEDIMINSEPIQKILQQFGKHGVERKSIDDIIKELSNENLFAVKFLQIKNGGIFAQNNYKAISEALRESCPPTRTLEEAQAHIDKMWGASDYKVSKLLGVGTVAETYLAKDKAGKEVCIKVLKDGITADKIAADKEKFLKLVIGDTPKDKLSEGQKYLIKNIDDLAEGIAKEVDFKNEMQAAEALRKHCKVSDVAKPIAVKDGIYVMEKAPGISVKTLVDYFKCEQELKYIKKALSNNPNDSFYATRLKELEAQMVKIKSRAPEFEDFDMTAPQVKRLLNNYIDLQVEQFSKIERNGKVIHADIHPGNIFINLENLKSGKGKLFTLIDTGNTINLTKEQAKVALRLTTYIKNGNTKDLTTTILDGAVLPSGLTKENAAKQIEAELKKYFFDSETKIGTMNIDTFYALTDNLLRKYNIIPNNTQLNLNKAKVSAKNSFQDLLQSFFSKKYGDIEGDSKVEILGAMTRLAKDGIQLQSKLHTSQAMQESKNLFQMSIGEAVNFLRNPNMNKTNSTEYLTYRLKQNMPLANDENVLSQILEK